MKVLFHIDQCENWQMLLDNVSNMLSYFDQHRTECHIEMVANGPAVGPRPRNRRQGPAPAVFSGGILRL